ncbi:MAG: hypothetical protein HY566_02730 [Candidatus Kerfeldbacteria bacterium]|nr:hypothetical protein [Candidatus Kerfeldbacteria bacterium]
MEVQPPWLQLFIRWEWNARVRPNADDTLAAKLVERDQDVLYRLQQFNRDLRRIKRAMPLQKHEDAVFKRDVASHLRPLFLARRRRMIEKNPQRSACTNGSLIGVSSGSARPLPMRTGGRGGIRSLLVSVAGLIFPPHRFCELTKDCVSDLLCVQPLWRLSVHLLSSSAHDALLLENGGRGVKEQQQNNSNSMTKGQYDRPG